MGISQLLPAIFSLSFCTNSRTFLPHESSIPLHGVFLPQKSAQNCHMERDTIVELSAMTYHTSGMLICDDETTISGRPGSIIIHKEEPNERKWTESPCLFILQNSTMMISDVVLNLDPDAASHELLSPRHSRTHPETESSSICGILKDSSLTLQKCKFVSSSKIPPFLISTESQGRKNKDSTLTVIECNIKNTNNLLPAMSTLDLTPSYSMSSTVHIISCAFSNQKKTTQSGLAFSNRLFTQLCSSHTEVSSCEFHNISSAILPQEAQTTIESELLIGNRLWLVENSLFGTVASVLGSSRDFLALNTTLLNCVNSEVTEGTTFTSESETYNITTDPTQIAKKPTISTHLFNNCTFTGDKLSLAFTVILFSNYSGRLTFNSTTFDFIRRNDKSMALLDFGGDVDAFPTLTFDRSSVLFSRDGNSISDTQIIVRQSVNVLYVSSNFTHHPSATRTGSRLAFTTVGCDFHTFSGCRVIGQSTEGNGGVLAQSAGNPILSCFDSLFESNSAKGAGGCFTSYGTQTHAQRCIFRGNTADNRGGAMFFDYGAFFRFEDTHFEGNKAFMCYPSSSQLAHYRGNDINLLDSQLGPLTRVGAMVGCTSSSEAPKLGYYIGTVANGNLTNEDDYLPTPSDSLPKAAGVWEVAEGGTGDCSVSSPCATIAAALVKISTSASKTKFQSLFVQSGEFSFSHNNIPVSFEIVGLGWARDTSTFTTIMSEGISLSENTNTTFRALTLLPSSKAVTSITMMSPSTLYLTDVKADRLSEQTKSLFVFGAGKINVCQCHFDEVSLADCPLISITGSATVSMVHVWFSRIARTVGRGASCVDSSTTSTLSITASDCGACSSVGRAGCFDLSTTNTSASLSIGVYFSKNSANTGNDPSITQIANDLFISGYSTAKISIGSSRSISSPNHVVQNGNAVTLIYPSRGFNDFGMNHPISTRFERASPLVEFGTLNLYVHNLPESSTEVTANIFTKNPLTLEPLEFSKKKVALRFCTLKTKDQNQSPFFTVGEKASLKLFQTPTTVNIALSVPLVVLTTATSSFTSYIVTYDIIDLTHTSPFFRAEQGSLLFSSTSFSRGVKLSGCAFIHSTGSEVKFDSSKFSDFTSNSNGSVLHSSGASIVATKSTFTSCSAKHGGVFFVALSGSNTVTLVHDKSSAYPVTFSNCSAVGEAGGPDNAHGLGGVIFVKGTSSAANPIRCSTTVSDDARFEGNKALEGSDMFIEKDLFDGKTTESLQNFGGGSYSEDFRIVIEGRTGTPGEMEMVQTQLMVQPKVSVNGSEVELTTGKSGNDDENCKWTSSFCETLAFGIKFLNQTYQNGKPIPQNIQFVWNMTYTEKEIVVTNQIVTLTGTTTSNKNTAKLLRSQLKIDESLAIGACLFTITNTASLTVKNLDICAIATAGLFELRDDADSLELNDVGILCQVDLPHEYCLIKSTKGPVTLVGCCFDRMKGSNDRPILNAPLISFSSTEASLSISTTTFNSFSVSTTPLIAVVTEQELTFLSNTFTGINVALQTATLVRVTSSSLGTVVTPSLWAGSFTQSQRLLDFVGCDSSLTSVHPFFESSLLFYLLPPTGTVVAGQTTNNEESEHPNCGTDRLRCSSLSSALASALAHSLSTSIFVSNTTSLSTPFEVTSTASFTSTSGKQTISQSLGGSIVLNGAGQSLSLTSLVFALSPTSTVSTLVTVSTGSLSLTTCSIGTDIVTEMNTFMTTLLDVANGCSLSLSGTEFKNLKFTHPSLGTAIVLRLGSSFSSDSGSLFKSVSSNATGSLIFVHSADLETTSKTSPFSLIKTTFEPLPARLMTIEEKKRYAGEVGNEGAESLLYFWFPHTESETTLSVDENGEDHRNCGIVQLPCRTLKTGFASLKASGTTIILNRDDTIQTTLTAAFESQTIQSKTPQTISVSPSGAISISSSRQLTLHTLSFTFESGARSLPFVKVTTGSLSVEGCSFGSPESDTTLTSVLFDFAGTLRVDSVNFTKLKTSQSAGLFKLELTDTETLCFSTTRMESCTSTGAPLLSLVLSSTTQQTNWDFNLKGISFTEESSNSVPSGALVFISGSSFATQIVPSRFPPIDPETDEDMFWGLDSTTSVESSLLVYLVEPGNEIDVDGTNGKDIAHCGHFGVACSTIGKGIRRANAADTLKINVHDTVSLNETIIPNEVSLMIAGQTQTREMKIYEDGQFSVPCDSLSFSLIAFTTSVPSFSSSLITVSASGSLSVTSCSFTGFSSNRTPSILFAEVGVSKSVTFSSTTFTSCNSTESSRSGVVDVSLVEGSTFTISNSGNPFSLCSSPDSTADHVFISHPTLSTKIVEGCLQFDWQKSTPSRGFVGKEGNYPIPVPLSLYFLPLPISTFVSSDSCDVSVCGFSEYPCSSLSFLNSRIGSTPDTQITFNTNLEHSGELSLSERLTVIGSNNEMTIKETALSETNTALFTIPSSATISSLSIVIPSNFKHSCLLQCQSGSLEMWNCSLSQEGHQPIPSTLIQILSGSSLHMNTTFFNSINSSNEKAGVILTVLTESTSFLLHNNTFTSCTCSGQANAIFLELVNTTTVHSDSFDYLMTDLIFDSPSSNSNTEIEIDVFVVGNNLDKTMTSTKWDNSFSREKGSSLWGEDTATGLNISLLPYLVALEGPVEIDDDGKGFEKCGHFFLFCNSLELGLRRMKEASVDTMKVMERITATTPIEPQCDLCIEGNDESSTLSFSLGGCFINSPKDATQSTLSFSSLAIIVPSESTHQSLFSSLSGTLSFTSCTITGSSPNPISFSLITLATGDLLFSSTHSKSIVLQSTPLITSSGSITMTNCNFTSISRVDGLGCVLEASSDGEVCVRSSTFSSCHSGGTPTWILLNGKNPNTVRLSNWEGTLSPSSPRPSVLLFIPTNPNDPPFSTDPSNHHSLLYEFYPRDPTMIVVRKNEVSEDHQLCGSSQLPCLTIDKSVGLTKVRTVEINGEGEISSVMKLDGDLLWIGGHKKKGIVQMKEGGRFVNNQFDDPDTLHLSFITLDVSSSTMTTSESLILNENGETELISIAVTTSSSIQPSLMRLTGGSSLVSNLTLSSVTFLSTAFDLSGFDSSSFVDMTVYRPSNQTPVPFISAKDGKDLLVKSCFFAGETSSPSNSGESEESGVCDWETSLIEIEDTKARIELTSFVSLQIGAVSVSGESVTIDASSFENNTASNTSFPSVRRNVRCSHAEVRVTTLGGGDGLIPGSPSWILPKEGCSVSSTVVNELAPFFVPTLNPKESRIEFVKKTGELQVSLAGALLIPCGLEVEVSEFDDEAKQETGTKTTIDLSKTLPSKWTETNVQFELTHSNLTKSINATFEWRGRLVFGNGQRTSEFFVVKQSAVFERKALATKSMKIVIPVAGSIAVLFVLLLVVILCCRRRKQRMKKEDTQQLLSTQELDGVEIKVEELPTFHNIDDRNSNHFPTHTHLSTLCPTSTEDEKNEKEAPEPEETFSPGNMCEAMGGGEKNEVKFVDKRNTLYSRLHSTNTEEKRIARFQVQFGVARGLEQLCRCGCYQEMLVKLNPHNIVITSQDDVFLKLHEDSQQSLNEPTQQKTEVAVQKDDSARRWMAPEVVNQNGTEVKTPINEKAAAVFSLGLVLWEIETGDVPFGELDEINAQRQLGLGARPNMNKVGSELKELVEECLEVDPSQRPSFKRIFEKLIENGTATKQITNSAADSLKQQLESKQRQLPHHEPAQ